MLKHNTCIILQCCRLEVRIGLPGQNPVDRAEFFSGGSRGEFFSYYLVSVSCVVSLRSV